MKAYIQLSNDGKHQKIIDKNKDKTPFGYPPVLTSMMWRADSFPVCKRTESKLSYPYGGVDLN